MGGGGGVSNNDKGFLARGLQDTARAMTQLRRGDVRPVMVTGDNHLTGVHIAKEANMFFSPLSHGVNGHPTFNTMLALVAISNTSPYLALLVICKCAGYV